MTLKCPYCQQMGDNIVLQRIETQEITYNQVGKYNNTIVLQQEIPGALIEILSQKWYCSICEKYFKAAGVKKVFLMPCLF